MKKDEVRTVTIKCKSGATVVCRVHNFSEKVADKVNSMLADYHWKRYEESLKKGEVVA